MNRLLTLFFLFLGSLLLLDAQANAKTRKPAAPPKASTKSLSKAHSSPASAKPKHRAHGRSRAGSHTTSWRNRQMAPSADRYREIQEALASKGYLKTQPTGAWDAESQEALKHFQADQNLHQTGKVNSISLIALGLGPAKPAEPLQLPAQPAAEPAH